MPSARQSLLAAATLLTLALGARWLAHTFTPNGTAADPATASPPSPSASAPPAPASRCPAGTLEDGGACVPVPIGSPEQE